MDLGEKNLAKMIAKIIEEGKTAVSLYRKYLVFESLILLEVKVQYNLKCFMCFNIQRGHFIEKLNFLFLIF